MTTGTAIGYLFNRSILELTLRTDGNFTITNAGDTAKAAKDALLFSPGVYYLIGTLMSIIMLTGFSTNLAILYTYATNRKIRTVDNTLIIGLALSDIGQAIFGVPLVAVSSFSKQWIFGHAVCQYYAFITTCFGIAQISMLTVIAMERYFVIVRHDRRLTNTPCRCVIIILCSFIYGSCWATGPLLGWSGYKEEEIGIACCVKWEVKDRMAFSYTISLCTFGWFIPLFLILFGYISIACSIYSERNKRMNLRRKVLPSKTNRERKVAITVLIMIGAFIISWTPYSAVSLWSAVGDFHNIPLWVQVAPAVFAKCSIIWNPLIYVARHENFRKGVKDSLSSLKFWKRKNKHNKKYINCSKGGKNCFQQSTREYKGIVTNKVKGRVRQSVTSDNYDTYMESPVRSISSLSVFFNGLPSFNRTKMRRHLTLFSTLNTSQQLEEKSESDSIESINNEVACESKCIQTDKVTVHIPASSTKELSNKCVQTDLLHQVTIENVQPVVSEYQVHETSLDVEAADKNTASGTDDTNGTTNLIDGHPHTNENINSIKSSRVGGRNSPITTKFNLDEELNMNLVTEDNKTLGQESQNSLSVSLEVSRLSPVGQLHVETTKNLSVLKENRKLLKQKIEIIYHDNQPSDVSHDFSERHDFYESRDCPSVSQDMYREETTENSSTHMHCSMDKNNEKSKDTPILTDIRSPKRRLSVASMSQGSVSKVSKSSYNKTDTCREMLTRGSNFNDSNGLEMRTYIYKPITSKLQFKEKENEENFYATNLGKTDVDENTTIIRQSTV